MISNNVSKMLNEQINAELFSAYQYWQIAKYFDNKGLKGFSSWYKVQAQEEINHARKIYTYMQNQGCAIKLSEIKEPKDDLKDNLSVAKLALSQEEKITKMINGIYREAIKEKDYRTMNFLDWFIDEQDEEEINAKDNLILIKLAGDSSAAMSIADSRMAKRKKEA